jgi:hypothetical protein
VRIKIFGEIATAIASPVSSLTHVFGELTENVSATADDTLNHTELGKLA